MSVPARRPRSSRSRLLTLAGIAGLALSAGLVTARSIGLASPQPLDDSDALLRAPVLTTEDEAALPEEVRAARALSGAFERASDVISPSVVNITTRSPMRDFRTGRTSLVDSGVGSGLIVSASGYVLTNNHVIAEATDAVVRLTDGREFQADLIGRDALRDLALLRIEAQDLTPAVFADSDDVRVGEWVLAVGSPFGFSSTVTAGIVSAKGRGLGIASAESAAFEDFIQTDASVNRGNSGGPLINLDGQVVGINSAIFSPSGGSVGIGFAIPSHLVQAVYDRLREGGTVGRGWIGVDLSNVDATIARQAGLDQVSGAVIARVIAGGPADKAGLQASDIVTAFNGRAIRDHEGFRAAIGIAAPGTVAHLDVVRDGERVPLNLTIGDFGALATLAASQIDDNGNISGLDSAAAAVLNLYGMSLSSPTSDELAAFRRSGIEGVRIDQLASAGPTRAARLLPGDIIMRINDQPVRTPSEAVAALAQGNSEGTGVKVRVYRDSEGLVGETVIKP